MSWTVWAPIASGGVLATVAVFTYIKTNPRKRIIWQLVSTSTMFSRASAGGFHGLQVLSDDKPVTAPRTYKIVVKNAGRAEMKSSDVNDPLGFRFDGSVVKADANYVDRGSASERTVEIGIEGNEIELESRLLNPRDQIILRVLVDESPSSGRVKEPTQKGAIAGFKFERKKERRVAERFDIVLRADLPTLAVVGLLVWGFVSLINSTSYHNDLRAPSLYGKTAPQAESAIGKTYFLIGRTFYVPSVEKRGTVVYQSVRPGDKYNSGDFLDIGLSSGK